MKKIKPVPNRHKPQGLTILHEDQDIIVIDKSSGLLTVRANYENKTPRSFNSCDNIINCCIINSN